MTTRVVCWNIAGRKKPWEQLREMDADVALLQEARTSHLRQEPEIPEGHWNSHWWNSDWYKRYWSRLFDVWPAVVRLSTRVEVDWFVQVSPINETLHNWFAVSGVGTVAAARVRPRDPNVEPFVVVSMYARWIGPHPSTGSKMKVGYPDGSAHRIISDLSAFIGNVDPSSHRILAAGDLNTVYGAEDTRDWTTTRDRTIWDRMDALGLEFLGPQAPNGRQAEPVPDYISPDTKNVVTCYTTHEGDAAKATKQLDYVFASRGFHEQIRTRALNSMEEWGASDHCRLLIEVNG
ncbi:MAG: endonuclease/exonuclease/phosphatase family protein [Acidobacteria bacterium]|nr:endonuclease/exonuclease/phosphatase family protein [Acidobacteriota bacterium]